MQAIRSLNGDILGYTLPPEFEKLNKLVKIERFGNKKSDFIYLSTIEKLKKMISPPELGIKKLKYPVDEILILQKILNQSTRHLQNGDIENLNKSISRIKLLLNNIKEKEISTHNISQEIYQKSEKLDDHKKLSLSDIIAIITLLYSIFFQLIQSYPTIKEIYKDLTYDPISEICGAISELEREAVKFVEVDHRGGIDIYQYPKGKKSVDFVLNGTQLCMLTEPKGNTKRVKVVFQLENHKQIIGYVDRNKLKRLYKNE